LNFDLNLFILAGKSFCIALHTALECQKNPCVGGGSPHTDCLCRGKQKKVFFGEKKIVYPYKQNLYFFEKKHFSFF